MNAEQNPLSYINKIKLSVDQGEQTVWACEASAKCYKEETRKLKDQNARLVKDIEKIKMEIEQLQPQVKILEDVYRKSLENIKVSVKVMLQLRLHKDCLNAKLEKQKEKSARFIREYKQHIESVEQELKQHNPKYQIVRKKEVELKLIKIRCAVLQQKIKERTEINRRKKDIRKKMYYAFFVNFARSWLRRREYVNTMQKLREVTIKEREAIRKNLETRELLNQQQLFKKRDPVMLTNIHLYGKGNLGATKDMTGLEAQKEHINHLPLNPFLSLRNVNSQSTQNNLEEINKTKEGTSDDFARPSNPNDSLRNLTKLLQSNTNELTTPVSTAPVSDTGFAKPQFNAARSKIRILEDVTLNPSHLSEIAPSVSKEERNKAIEEKVQRTMDNVKRKLSRKTSKDIHNLSLNDSQQLKISQEGNSKTQMHTVRRSEGLDNLNLSCDNLRFVSQESDKSASSQKMGQPMQMQLENLSQPRSDQPVQLDNLSQEKLGNKSRQQIQLDNLSQTVTKKRVNFDLGQNTIKKYSQMQFFPEQPSGVMDAIFGEEVMKPNDQHFLKPSGTEEMSNRIIPLNPCGQDKKNAICNNAANGIFKKPADVSGQPFDKTLQFKEASAAHSNITFMGTDKQSGNDMMNMNTIGNGQYCFGDVTQISQPYDMSADYDMGGYLSPELPQNSISNQSTNPNDFLFSFGKSSNTVVGFKF